MIDGSQSRRRIGAIALLGAVAWLVSAGAAAACLPEFKDGWIRLPAPGGMGMAAGFGSFHNGCKQPVRVTSVSSSAFADVSLHETTLVDGVSRMRAVPALVLPPGGAVTLAPGGLHLMLMDPGKPVQAGQSVPVRFVLDDGQKIQGALQVRTP
ncbi:copper chaperone PCu(A)C [Xanthomonas maliensis]|uniref:copper chaperone PCu(A)C n=1 Tax=Xanthomonas maliensis TaxID=1321368 RepID=UPI00039DF8D9|nr:copper chaperone PCu(A)C [Xanthomonas maliensis]KAB7764622.1 copper chaperone PCu(A)C [Xanthomonas maliensis]